MRTFSVSPTHLISHSAVAMASQHSHAALGRVHHVTTASQRVTRKHTRPTECPLLLPRTHTASHGPVALTRVERRNPSQSVPDMVVSLHQWSSSFFDKPTPRDGPSHTEVPYTHRYARMQHQSYTKNVIHSFSQAPAAPVTDRERHSVSHTCRLQSHHVAHSCPPVKSHT